MNSSVKQSFGVLLLLATLISVVTNAETDRSCRKKVICADTVKATTICADELIVKTGCCASRTITVKDFMDANGNLSQTFVITEPGKYSLGENIAFAPVDQDACAIQILANDVHLNLCGNTLTQGNDTFEVFAVQIGEGFAYTNPDNVLKNISVTNGNITKFTGSGIFCYNASFEEPTAQAPFESLTFTDLNILDCGSSPSFVIAGIYLESFADGTLYDPETRVAYKNVMIENCAVNRSLGNGSIYISTGDNVVIDSTQANDLSTEVSPFGLTFGYWLFCRNLQMINCQGNGAKDFDPEATTAQCGGAFILGCINVYLKDCQFNDSYGEADAIVNGANLSNTQNGIFENVQFNNPRGGEFASLVNGVHMSDGALQQTQGNGLKFINCQFNGVRVSPTNQVASSFSQLLGFVGITLRNIAFENCQACNITTENPNRSAYGYFVGTNAQDPIAFFANSRNFTFTNCVASDIESPNNTIGYRLSVTNSNRRGTQASFDNTVLENCIAERIHSSSSDARVAGIFEGLLPIPGQGPFPALFNLFVKNCRVSDVRAGQGNPFSAGILVESVKRPNLTDNSVSDCDRGVLLTGSDLIFPDTLFQLATTFENATTFPPVFIDLTSIPAATPLQSFSNITQGNSIDIAPSPATIELLRNYIFSPTDLNTLDWQAGDEIVYSNNGGTDIGGLVSGNTYYAIVYVPGYSENGVVMNNTVDNCTVSGYEDAKPTTSSAWANNFAFNCGQPASEEANYDINWSGTAPVYAGDLSDYPTGSAKAFNVSLIP